MFRTAIPLLFAAFVALPVSASANLLRELNQATADVVERVMPSVVVVRTEATIERVYQGFFFGRGFRVPERLAGQGSGVIIDAAGYVLTSDHVVREAQQIEVILADETRFSAELVGSDRHTDLAVLRIVDLGEHVLTPIEEGDSDALRVGELAIAIGSPFSLSSSVTLGIISQMGRSLDLFAFEDFIQTDAAINPGNSGGPLVDVEGRLIGINAVIQTAGSRDSAGVGFAVPGNRAMLVARQIIEQGTVERPWLGILPRALNRAAANRLLGVDGGIVVAEVFRNTPAYKSGLYEGDVILSVGEARVRSLLDLQRAIFSKTIGEPIELTVWRNQRELSIEVVTERMPDERLFRR